MVLLPNSLQRSERRSEMETEQCQAALVHAQQRYLDAKGCFDALDAVRDQLLEPLDSGERLALTAAEQLELAWLDREERKVYPSVLAAEAPLLAAARAWLAHQVGYCERHPEYAQLAGDHIPPGMRDHSIDLASHLVRDED